jgi:hypothetical protein
LHADPGLREAFAQQRFDLMGGYGHLRSFSGVSCTN